MTKLLMLQTTSNKADIMLFLLQQLLSNMIFFVSDLDYLDFLLFILHLFQTVRQIPCTSFNG